MDNYPALSLARNRITNSPTRGDCQIRRNISEDGTDSWLDVAHADPHILVADEVLHTLLINASLPERTTEVWLAMPEVSEHLADLRAWLQHHDHELDAQPWPCTPDPAAPCYLNALLHIDGRNRTVIYRIGHYLAELNAWKATWPD